ncbi:MAG: hypothetical protein IKI64_04670 [Clostridia bacterium]|nr:hypothetical protein [Clostridia bacterium]
MSKSGSKTETGEKLAKVESIHENHRERVRRAYIEHGDLSGMHDHQILELILFYAIKRRDVNPLAHRLIDRFGSLKNVLRAGVDELCTAGLSESTAVLLKLVGDVGFAIDRREAEERTIETTNDALEVCYKLLYREKNECVALICLNAAKHISKISIKTDGLADKVSALPKWIVDTALKCGSHAVILAHNHPSGSIAPSQQDKATTSMLERLLAQLDIKLYDHVIVTQSVCYSMNRDFEKRMDQQPADGADGSRADVS